MEDFQQRLALVEEATVSYRVRISSDVETLADCFEARDEYESAVRPWLGDMMDMSEDMDEYMSGHGAASAADVACLAGNMQSELDHHHGLACQQQDLDDDRREVERHVDAMLDYVEHSWDRYDQMMEGMETGEWHWGPMMSGCEDWSAESDECVDQLTHHGMMGDVCSD